MELTQLTFAVDTTPLDTADKKIRGLGEALKTLERPMNAIAKDSSTVASGVEEIGKSTDAAAKGLDKVERNAIKLADTMRFYRGEIVEVNSEQVALGANFTKTQSAFLAYNKLIGATSDQLKRIAKEFMDLNAMTSANTFDNQIKGISILTKQIEEHRKVQELAASGISLTKDQIVNLVRETNRLEQSMKSMGVSTEDATKYIQEQTNSYIAKAKELNSLIEISNRSEQQAKAEARANADALEQAKKLSDYRMQNWSSSVGSKSPELSSMKDHYQKAEREAADFYATMEAASNSYRSSFIANQEAEIKQMEKRKKMWQDLYGADNAAAIKEEEDAVKRLTAAENARMKNWAESVGMKSTELTEMSSYYSKQEQDAKSFYSAMQSASDSYRANFIANQEAEIKEMEKRKRMWKDLYGEDHAATIRAEADAVKQLADANTYTASKMEQLRAQVSGLEKGLTTASSNALYQFEKNLKATGVAADVAEKQVAEFTALLKRKQDAPSAFKEMSKSVDQMSKQVNHLARDVSVQLGDIAISLAGGQNPLMVLIQQGDQIRGALLRAKDQGVDTSQAMRDALSTMSSSFVDLGKMVGTFFVGSIESAGSALTRLITNYTALGASVENYKRSLASQGEAAFSAIGMINKLGAAFTFLAGTAILGVVGALAGLTIGLVQSIREHDQLVKTMVLYGASLNMSYSETMQYAESLRTLGFTAGQATEFISTFAKAASFSAEEMRQIAPVALEAQKYLGISFEESAKLYEKLKEKPTEGLIEIAKKSGLIPPEIIKIINEYENLGQKDKAVSLAIQESLKNTTEQVERAKENYSGLAIFVMNAGSAVSKFFDTIFKSVWTKASGVDRIKAEIADLDQSIAELSFGGGEAAKPLIAQKKALEDQLHAMLDLENQQKINNQRNQEGVQIFDAARKEIEGMRKDAEKLDAKEMSQSTFIAKSIEQRAKAIGKTVDQLKSAANYSELMSTWTTKFAKDWADAQKKTTKGLKPKETFSFDLTNEVEESKKAYDRQLKIAKDYESSRRDILKNSYEARMISLGDYVGQEIKLSIQARDNQLEIARQGNEEYNALMQKNRKAIEDAAQSAIDKGGSVSAIREKEKKDLEDLDRKVKGVNEAYLSQAEALDAATDKRFSDFYKELAKSAIESEKSLTDFTATVKNNANARKEEIDLQLRLIGAHGAEAEAIKASSAAMKSYAPEIAKQTKLLADQEKVLRDLNEQMKDATPEEAERLDVLGMQALENTAKIRKNLDRTVAQARQDSEESATDAATLYQISKYNELKGTLSDSIYTAIFEGGKKGGDVLKNYLMKEFKNFVITAFIQPVIGSALGSLGISAAGAVTGGAVGSSAVSTITSGLGAASGAATVAGWLGSAGGAISGFTTALTASAQSLIGLTGTTAQMATSLGAAGHTAAAGYSAGAQAGMAFANAVPYIAAATLALNALGVFRKTELKDTGIRGTLGTESNIEGYKTYRKSGTLFSGPDWWDEKMEADPKLVNSLQYQFDLIQSGMVIMAESLGSGADSVKNFSKSINVSFKDLDAEGISKKLTELYADISNEMAAGVLRELVKESDPVKFNDLKFSETILGLQFNTIAQLEASIAVWNKSIETGFDAAGNKLSEGWIRELGDAVNQANDILDSQTEKLIEDYQWFGETFSETLNRLSSSITIVNESFRDLGYTLMDVSLQGASKASDIISLFGGEDQYVQATGYFYENAYSQEEKAANLTNRLSEALGRVNEELPDSISGYRDLVDAYAKQGDAGREVWASLVQLFPAFKTLIDLNSQLAPTVSAVDAAYAKLTNTTRTAEDVANERISLEERLFNATATTAEIAEKARNAIDPMNRSLYDTVLAAERLKEATENLPDALESSLGRAPVQEELNYWIGQVASGAMTMQDAMKGIARDGSTEKLALQLLELTDAEGYLAETRKRQLSTMTPLQQEIQKNIWAVQDAKEAYQSLNNLVGLSADALTGVFKRVLKDATSESEARKIGENAAAEMLSQALINTFAGTIGNLISTAILQPITAQLVGAASTAAGIDITAATTSATSLTTGAVTAGAAVAVGGTTAAGALQSVVTQAVSAANSMAAILGTQEFKDAIVGVIGAVGDVSETIYGTFEPFKDITGSLNVAASTLDSVAGKLKEVYGFDIAHAIIGWFDFAHYLKPARSNTEGVTTANAWMNTERIGEGLSYLGSAFDGLKPAIKSAGNLKSGSEYLNTYIAGFAENVEGSAAVISTAAQYFTGISDTVDAVFGALDAATQAGKPIPYPEPGLQMGYDFATNNSELLKTIGAGAGQIGQAIIDSIAGETIKELEANPIFDGVLGADLQNLGIVLSQVGKGNVQSVSEAFDTLNVALAAGVINTAQYNTAIGMVTDAFKNGKEDARKVAETVEEAYNRLKNVPRTNEDIAREKISLEERLFNATATTAQIAEKARNAIDAHNQSLYDEVIAAEAVKALNQTKKEVEAEMFQADIRLAQAMGNKSEADRLQREAFIAGLGDLTEAQKTAKIAAYDYSKAIDKQIAILQERTGLENSLHQLLGNTAILRERELAALDPSNRALQQRIWAIEDARDATDKALAALERATAEQIKQLEKSFTATDLAMQVLEKAVDKEKQILQKQLEDAQKSTDSIKRVFEILEEAVRSLRGEVEQTSKMQVKEARATLSTALTSGIPSDTAALEDAISVLKADVEQGLYATSYDKSRAFLTLANDLEKLKQNSEPQLTTAEQQVKLAEDQIKQLDDLLEKARDQVSAIRDVDASLFGIDKNIQDVEKAQSQLLSATQSEQEARKQIDKLNEQLLEFKTQAELLRGIDNSIIGVKTAIDNLAAAITAEKAAVAVAGGGGGGAAPRPVTNTVTTTTTGSASASSLISTAIAGGGAYEQINSDGSVTVYQAGGAITIPADAAKNLGYYANGGYYPGGLALVGEEGPELINFSNPGMVYTAAQSANLMQADNSELAEELRALRQEVQMLRAEARATAVNTSKTARILDDVTQGGDSLKTTAA